MINLGNLAENLGLRRRKSLADRVQDAAEEVVDRARDAYSATVETVVPALSRGSRTVATRADKLADDVSPALHRSRKAAERTLFPMMHRSRKVAQETWERTEKGAARGLDKAADAAEDAATAVAATAAATGAAATGAAATVGSFFAAVFSFLWSTIIFLLKAAILAGVAYAGWQWLQSRREQQSWESSTAAEPSSTYGTVSSGTAGSTTPSPAGMR